MHLAFQLRYRWWGNKVYLQLWAHAVDVMASVTAVTQQHVLAVSLPAAHFTAGIQDGLGPEHTALQCRQMQEKLREAGAGQKRFPPALQHRLHLSPTFTSI